VIVLVDTNVVFDVIGKREPHYAASNQILYLCRRKALVGAIAFHTIANIFYQYGKAAVPFLKERVLEDFSVHGASSTIVQEVMRWGLNDFEDALQTAAAQTAGASFIVTRNVKDFKFPRVPALTPKEFLKRFHPTK
jgi:predicted nucleic acid-binding protein